MKKSPKIDERKFNISPSQHQLAIGVIASTKSPNDNFEAESNNLPQDLVGKDGSTLLFTQHQNLEIFATTRSGKSVLVSAILTQALVRGWPVVALDFPKEDGTSTFSDFTAFMRERGAYFDISKQSNNLFEIPDLRKRSPKCKKRGVFNHGSK